MNVLTFDIEEWFHILDHDATKTETEWSKFSSRIHKNVDRILKILDDNDQQATCFCLGWVARNYPEVIRTIDNAGHEIASHSDRHQLAYEQTEKEFASDLSDSLASLTDLTGKPIDTYRIPGFSLTASNQEWVFDALLAAGIRIDCSVFPANRSHGGLPKFSQAIPTLIRRNGEHLHEFPLNTTPFLGRPTVFSGGGYFRLFPYPVIRKFMCASGYVMSYFHPRDFDSNQPVIPGLSMARRFKSYYGLAGCEEKLQRLLGEFEFITVGQADKKVDWKSAPIVSDLSTQ